MEQDMLEEWSRLTGLPVDLLEECTPMIADTLQRDTARTVVRAILADVIEQSSAGLRNPFTAYDADELRARPVPAWIIDGVLPGERDAMLFGEACSGKTFVALDMLLCIANGVPWMGHQVPEPLDVALFVGEKCRGSRNASDDGCTTRPSCRLCTKNRG